MIFGGGFIGFLGVIVVIRLLAQIRDQNVPVRYAGGSLDRAPLPKWAQAILLAAGFVCFFAALQLLGHLVGH
jgi:hypothetical protein